jgi:hypothetical protein
LDLVKRPRVALYRRMGAILAKPVVDVNFVFALREIADR